MTSARGLAGHGGRVVPQSKSNRGHETTLMIIVSGDAPPFGRFKPAPVAPLSLSSCCNSPFVLVGNARRTKAASMRWFKGVRLNIFK